MIYKTIQQQVTLQMLAILLISLLLLTLLCGYLYVLKKPLKQRKQTQQTLHLLERELKTGMPLQNQIAAFQQQIDQLNLKLSGSDSQLTVNQKIARIIAQLDHLSDQQQVRLISVKPENARNLLSFREQSFDIKLQGSYFDLFNWFYQLDTQLGPVVIKQFTMYPEHQSSVRNMSLTLASYQFLSP